METDKSSSTSTKTETAAESWRSKRADLMHGQDVVQEALESAGFECTVIEPGATTTEEREFTRNPTAINEPVILGIKGPNGISLSLSLNVTP